MNGVTVAVVGDHDASVVAHRANPLALELAGAALGMSVVSRWIPTEALAAGVTEALTSADGVWCVPATPYRSETGALNAIRFARENHRPFLGTCGGFQHALLEFGRNVLGIDARHAESHPGSADRSGMLIAPLRCGLVEVGGMVCFEPGSRLASMYGAVEAMEGYHCNYGLNSDYEALLSGAGFHVIARDPQGEVRAMELLSHPFYLITLFQPERAALTGRAHPIVNAWVAACAGAGRP
jgi:CTP synthase (UTP-ammonia lyase)